MHKHADLIFVIIVPHSKANKQQTDGRTDKQTDKQTDRQTHRQINPHNHDIMFLKKSFVIILY